MKYSGLKKKVAALVGAVLSMGTYGATFNQPAYAANCVLSDKLQQHMKGTKLNKKPMSHPNNLDAKNPLGKLAGTSGGVNTLTIDLGTGMVMGNNGELLVTTSTNASAYVYDDSAHKLTLPKFEAYTAGAEGYSYLDPEVVKVLRLTKNPTVETISSVTFIPEGVMDELGSSYFVDCQGNLRDEEGQYVFVDNGAIQTTDDANRAFSLKPETISFLQYINKYTSKAAYEYHLMQKGKKIYIDENDHFIGVDGKLCDQEGKPAENAVDYKNLPTDNGVDFKNSYGNITDFRARFMNDNNLSKGGFVSSGQDVKTAVIVHKLSYKQKKGGKIVKEPVFTTIDRTLVVAENHHLVPIDEVIKGNAVPLSVKDWCTANGISEEKLPQSGLLLCLDKMGTGKKVTVIATGSAVALAAAVGGAYGMDKVFFPKTKPSDKNLNNNSKHSAETSVTPSGGRTAFRT